MLMSTAAFATHSQSTDLTYKCLSGNQYEITLSFYRDCAGVNAPSSVTVNISSVSCGQNYSITLNPIAGTGKEITPVCQTSTTQCNGGPWPGVQQYIYKGNTTFPMQCSDWVMSFSLCCRNGAINTITNPLSDNIYVEAHLDNLNYPCNSSPVFSNLPVPFVCVGQKYCFGHGATDIDGDSLSYELVTPSTSDTTKVNYLAPYTATQPLSSNPIVTFNGATGDICMTPNTIQVTVLAVLVKEWKNGKLVGSVLRDMQLRILNCNNSVPSVSGINGTNQFSISACAGTPLTFTVNSADADAGQTLSLVSNNSISGASFNASAGSRPVGTFSWTPTMADISGNPYCFTVKVQDDACPYNASQVFTYCIKVNGFSVTTTSTATACGTPTGTAIATTVNATVPVTYNWMPSGGNAATATGLGAGIYTVVITDANGCTGSSTASITELANTINGSITVNSTINCFGGSNGSMTISASGGSGSYSYSWNTVPSQNSATATGLTAGIYQVVVTDGNGCTRSFSNTITQPAILAADILSTSDVSCFGSKNGSATVSVTGGTTGYTYSWSTIPVQTGTKATGLSAGTYSVLVTDAKGCTSVTSAAISQAGSILINFANSTDVSCFGGSDGIATANASGGTPPYKYMWSTVPQQTTQNIGSLAIGTYAVTVTDSQGCTAASSTGITQPTQITIAITSVKHVDCFNTKTGSVSVVANGGTGSHTFLWENAPTQNSATAINLGAGIQNLIVADANGCTAGISTTIMQPQPLQATTTVTDLNCSGNSNGTARVFVNGGSGPYTYNWNTIPVKTSANINSLTAGSYTAIITDAKGCTIQTTVTLTQPPAIVSSTSVSPPTCPGQSATISVSATGGQGTLSYSWSNGAGSGQIKFVKPYTSTNYKVVITDSKGCTKLDSVTVTVNVLLKSSLSLSGPTEICEGASVILTASLQGAGTSNVTVGWNNGLGTGLGPFTVSPSTTTLYIVKATDNCSNSVSDSLLLKVNKLPVIKIAPLAAEDCKFVAFTFKDTAAANSNYSYVWDLGDGTTSTYKTPTHTYNQSGVYVIKTTVTSNKGCVASQTTSCSVTVYPSPRAGFMMFPAVATTLNPTISFVNGSQFATKYLWQFGDGSTSTLANPEHTYKNKGQYKVKLTSVNNYGCLDTASNILEIKPEFSYYIPNAFTPNGDRVNDEFKGDGQEMTAITMTIFDRWGEMIFKTDDINTGWDGRANYGDEVAQQGIYVYRIKVTDFKGYTHDYLGHVSLLK